MVENLGLLAFLLTALYRSED